MTNSEESAGKTKAVVYALSRQSRCYACDRKLLAGELVELKHKDEDREVLCQTCAGFDDLEILWSGNAKITRLAGKYSGRQYAIMKWSDMWKCYERKGVLLDPQAIDRAEQESGIKLSNRQSAHQQKSANQQSID